MIPHNAIIAAHDYLLPSLRQAECVVDATAGNGHDTLFLCRNTPPECRIWAFDIQAEALRSAKERVCQHGFTDRVQWIQADHAQLGDHVDIPVDAAVFNLGFLPGHDHVLTTKPDSLGQALNSLLKLLKPQGRISIVAYPGHGPGQEEVVFIENFLADCAQRIYVATRLEFINQRNYPAILYTIGNTGRNLHEDTSPDYSQRTR
jgi:ubiquinone/menaquinone biosynthesis C-methylase UbiE